MSRHRTRTSSLKIAAGLLSILAILLISGKLAEHSMLPTSNAELRRAWLRAGETERFAYQTTILQTTRPTQRLENAGRHPRTDQIAIRGQVDHVREALSFQIQEGQSQPVAVRVEGNRAFGRVGQEDDWHPLDQQSGFFGNWQDPLGYLAAAVNVRKVTESLESDDLLAGQILPAAYSGSLTRFAFDLDSVRYAGFMREQMEQNLRQTGKLPNGVQLALPAHYLNMEAQGSIWVDDAGLPVRQVMQLAFPPEKGAYDWIEAEITTQYSDWSTLPAFSLATALRSPWHALMETANLVGVTPGSLASSLEHLSALTLASALLALLFVGRKARAVRASFSAAVIGSMLLVPLLQADQVHAFYDYQRQSAPAHDRGEPTPADAVNSRFNPLRNPPGVRSNTPQSVALASHVSIAPASVLPASLLQSSCDLSNPDLDCDGDLLTNGIEVYELGTNPSKLDSDGDNISDKLEVEGFFSNGLQWYLDPLNPDSNGDTLMDGIECPELLDVDYITGELKSNFSAGICFNLDGDTTPDIFDHDNDGDGVPDSVDGDPHSFGGAYNATDNQFAYEISVNETGVPVFVDLEIRPTDSRHLAYTHNVLDWPTDDDNGQIQRKSDNTYVDVAGYEEVNKGENGDMILTPLLEYVITFDGNNPTAGLPMKSGSAPTSIADYSDLSWIDTDELDRVGISARQGPDANTLLLYAPLNVLRDDVGDAPVAWGTRMYYRPVSGVSTIGTNQHIRLIWMVEALQDVCSSDCDDEDNWVTQSNVIQTYYEDFTVTSLSVREDHGVELAIVAEPANVGDTNYEDRLWHLADTLQKALLRVQLRNNGNRFALSQINNFLGAWGISGLSVTSQSLDDQIDLLRIGSLSDASGLTTGVDVLNSVHNSASAGDMQSLLYAGEETARTLRLSEAYSRTLPGVSTIKLDLNDAPKDTVATMRIAPYVYEGSDTWAAADFAAYLSGLETALSTVFTAAELAKLATDSANIIDTIDDPDTARDGAVQLALNFYTALFIGLSSTVKSNDVVYGSDALGSYSLGSNQAATLIVKDMVDEVQRYYEELSIVEALVAATNALPAANALSATFAGSLAIILQTIGRVANGDDSSSLALSIQSLGEYYKTVDVDTVDFTDATGISLTGWTSQFAQQNAGISGTYLAWKAISGAYSIKWAWDQWKAYQAAIQLANNADDIVTSLKAGATANKIIKVSNAWAVVAFVTTVALIWGFFLFSSFETQMQRSAAIARAIGQTIVAVIIFAIALIPIIGWIIVGIIALIDALMMAICAIGREVSDDFEEGSDEDVWVCDGLSGAVAMAIVYLIYETFVPYDVDADDRLIIGLDTPIVEQRVLNDGFIIGNAVTVTAKITNTFHLDEPEMLIIKTTYTKSQLRELGKKSVFDYSLIRTGSDIHDSLPFNTLDWTDNDEYFEAAMSVPLTSVGINQSMEVYLNEGLNLNTVECWGFIGANEDWTCFDGSDGSKYTYKDTVSSYMGDDLQFDVLPATFAEFIALSGSSSGYRLSWDSRFPILRDADGDGLISSTYEGADPDDGFWDADGDGLTDLWEGENGFDALDPDMDDDGLWDYWEAFYGTDPSLPDTDGDGLTDNDEMFHSMARSALEADNSSWHGGWTIVYDAGLVTGVSANPFDFDSDDDTLTDNAEFIYGYHPKVPSILNVLSLDAGVLDDVIGSAGTVNYEATVTNELSNRFANGLLQAEFPVDVVQRTQIVGALGPNQSTTLSGTVTAPSVSETTATSVTIRAGAVIQAPGPERVLWLQMNEAAGALSFADVSSAPSGPHNGACSDNSTCPAANDAHLDFELNDMVVVNDSVDFDLDRFSISVALNYDTLSNGSDPILSKGSMFGIKASVSTLVGTICGENLNSGQATFPSTWLYVTLTHDGETAKMYVNGVERVSKAVTGPCTNDSDISIGGDSFDGQMDEVEIFGEALTPAYVAAQYQKPVFYLADLPAQGGSPTESNDDLPESSTHLQCADNANGFPDCPSSSAGVIGDGISLGAADGYWMWFAPDLGINGPEFSMAMWINPSNNYSPNNKHLNTHGQLIFGNTENGYNEAYPSLFTKGKKLLVRFGHDEKDGYCEAESTDMLTYNSWQHLTLTFDGTLFRAYIDKELVDTFAGFNCAGETPTESTSFWDIAYLGNGIYPALYFDDINITDVNSSWTDDPEWFLWSPDNIFDNGVVSNRVVWKSAENVGRDGRTSIDQWAFPRSQGDIDFVLCEYDSSPTYHDGCQSITVGLLGGTITDVDIAAVYEPTTDGTVENWQHIKTHDHRDSAGAKSLSYIQDFRNLYSGQLNYALYDTGFKGKLDEIRLYNTTLSDLGVETVYNEGVRALDMYFDEAPGKSTFADESLSAFSAGCSGTSCPDSGIPGRSNQSARFDGGVADDDGNDGVADYLALDATDDRLDIGTNDFTVAAWIKPDNVSGRKRIIAAERVNSVNGFGFGMNGDDLLFTTYGNQDFVADSVTLTAGEWTHVAVAFDSDNDASFYVNGTFVQKVTGSLAMSANDDDGYRIGAGTQSAGGLAVDEPFDGLIDHLVIEKIALGQAGIRSIMRESPVLNLHLDEDLDTTRFTDDTHYANDAICTNCPEAGSKGQIREAPVFDGIDDILQVADNSELDMKTFTIGFWVKPAQKKSDWQPLITKQNASGGSRNFGLFIEPDSMDLHFSIQRSNCSASVSETASTPLLENIWNHVMMTYDGSEMAVYINGSLQGAKTYVGAPCLNNHPVKIGNEISAYTPFAGSIDEVTILGKALDAAAVDAVYDYQAAWYDLTYQQSIMIDANAPEILSISVENGGYLPRKDTLFAFGVSDDDEVASVSLLLETPNGTSTIQAGPGDDDLNATWFYDFAPTGDGIHYLTVTAYDNVGNSSTSSRRIFYVDGVAPVGSLQDIITNSTQTTNDSGSGNRYVALSGTVTDPAPYTSLVDRASVSVEVIDQLGRALKGFTSVSFLGNDGRWTNNYPVMAANYGRYTVNASANDNVRNYFSGQIGVVALDDIGPRGDVILATDRITPTRTIMGSVNDVPYPAQSQRLHMHLEERAGATTFIDATRNQHIAACSNCPTAGVTGQQGSAAQFGSGNDLSIPADDRLEITDGTFLAWIYPTWTAGANGYDPTILATNDGAGTGYRWQIADDYQSILLDNGSTSESVAVSLTPNAWNHVALVMDGGAWTGYVNGIAAGASITQTFGAQTGLPLHIGGINGAGNFIGVLDEVVIYDRPLTADEVNDIADPLAGSITDLKIRFRTFAERDLDIQAGVWYSVTLDNATDNFSTWQFDVPTLPEDGYSIDLMASDALGNESYIGSAWSGFILLPDLSVSKRATMNSVLPGDPISYTIDFTNSVRIAAPAVTITEVVPAHTVFDATESDPGWACADDGSAGDTCTFSVGPMSSSITGSVAFAVDVLPSYVPAGQETVANVVTIDSILGHKEGADNGFTHHIPLIAAPDLAVQKVDEGNTIPLYGYNTYTITYSNSGTQSAMVVLTDTIPAKAAPVYQTRVLWDCPPFSNVGDCTLEVGEVPPGSSGSTTFRVAMATANVPEAEIVNTVHIGNVPGEVDLNPLDNSWTITTPVANDAIGIAINPVTVTEGMTATNYGSFIEYLDYSLEGEGNLEVDGGDWTWTWIPRDGPEDSTVVGLHIISYREDMIDTPFDVIVENVSPTIALSGSIIAILDEGYTLDLGPVIDPGDDTVTACTIHWGDGASEDCFAAIEGTLTHTYTTDGTTPTITVDLTDEDGQHVGVGVMDLTVTSYAPQIDIEKLVSVDGGTTFLDADGATGPTLTQNGPQPQFKYQVGLGTGTLALSSVVVSDTVLGAIAGPASGDDGDALLEVGETWTYVVTGTWAAGQNANTGYADGHFIDHRGSAIPAPTTTDDANYFGAVPQIDIEKHVSVDGGVTFVDADAPNGPMLVQSGPAPQFRYQVFLPTGVGSVPLSNVGVTDSVLGTVAGPASGDDGDGILEQGETWIYLAVGTWSVGQNVNTGSAAGDFTDAGGASATAPTATDDAHYFGAVPQIDIEKLVSVDGGSTFFDADAPTGPMLVQNGPDPRFRYEVTLGAGSGAVPLSNVGVTDSLLGAISGPTSGDDGDGILEPDETWLYVATGTWSVGQNINTGSANGDFSDDGGTTANSPTATDDANYFGAAPQLAMEKLVSIDGGSTFVAADAPTGPTLVQSGPDPLFRYDVTLGSGTGTVDVSNVAVTDSTLGPISGPASGDDGDEILEPGETWIYVGVGTWSAGQNRNTGSVTGDFTDDGGTTAASSPGADDAYFYGAAPQLDIQKLVSVDGASTFVDADAPTGPMLAQDGPAPRFRYDVTLGAGTGTVEVSNVTVTDSDLGAIAGPTSGDDGDTILEVGETWVYHATGVWAAGQYSNTGFAAADFTDDGGATADSPTAADDAYYWGQRSFEVASVPSLSIGKSVNNPTPLAGERISYEIVVYNNGSTATGGVISDTIPDGLTYIVGSADLQPDGAGAIGEPPQLATGLTITAGTSVTLTYQATVTSGTSGQIIANRAWVTSTEVSTPVSDSAQIAVVTFLDMSVWGNGVEIADDDTTPNLADATDFGSVDAGETATRQFTIANVGVTNLMLSGAPAVAVGGASSFDVTWQPAVTTVSPSSNVTFEVTFAPTAAGVQTATVRIDNNDVDENPYTFVISGTGSGEPNLGLVKRVNNATPEPGATVTYQIVITNDGNLDAKDGIIGDVIPTGVNPAGAITLDPPTAGTIGTPPHIVTGLAVSVGQRVTVTFQATVSNLAGGTEIVNRATVTATETGVAATDVATITVVVPEITVMGNTISVTNGDATPDLADFTDFGNVDVGGSLTRTFTVHNDGTSDLLLNGVPTVAFSGDPAFSISAQPGNTMLAGGAFTTFDVTFAPTAVGAQTATIAIVSNDGDENPFVFTVHGNAVETEEVTFELSLVGMAITGFEMSPTYPDPVGILDWTWTIGNPNLNAVSDIRFDVTQLDPAGVVRVLDTDNNETGVGARISVPNINLPGGDGRLDLGETFAHTFRLEWLVYQGFTFQVRAFGTVLGPTVGDVGGSEVDPVLLAEFSAELDPSMVDLEQSEEATNQLFLPLIRR